MPSIATRELMFPDVPVSVGESPWDLRMFLVPGGAALRKNRVQEVIASGSLGRPISARMHLVQDLHRAIRGIVAKGQSKKTLENVMTAVRDFYRYVDSAGLGHPTKANATHLYVLWMEWHAKRVDAKDEKATSRYRTGVTAGKAIADAIGRKPSTLFRAAHLEKNSRRKSALSPKAEKQNLEETFAFGHALLDITDALSEEAIRGTLPIIVRLRTRQAYEEWCGNVKKPLEQLTSVTSSRDAWRYSKAAAVRERWANDNRNANRSPAINIRMEAELLIFIAQTGMNLTQAWNMQLGDFRYESINDGYGVRRYKARRLGEIEFHIYSDYRPYFERYLAWRKVMFPNEVTGLLFPFINRASEGRRGKMVFTRLMSRLDRIGIKFIGPQMLRLTRINWMLRRLNDPTLTAEDHGHSLEVLHAQYERPNHQLAMIEVTNFWRSTDPAIKPPGPGLCTKQLPEVFPTTPPDAPQPDCQKPDGCLFCVHHRDIDSFDHVWSLMSLRHLKSLEMARDHIAPLGEANRPALRVVERITAKLEWYAQNNSERAEWANEAGIRMRERKYHKRWAGWIALAEIAA